MENFVEAVVHSCTQVDESKYFIVDGNSARYLLPFNTFAIETR